MTNRRRSRKKLTKALIVQDREGNASLVKADKGASRQLKETLTGLYNDNKIKRPPYEFDELAALLTVNTAHYRACRTKASDTAGLGWNLVPAYDGADEASGADEERERIEGFLTDPSPNKTLRETLEAVAYDYESIGWGFLEVVRTPAGDLQEINHIPAHTMRAHEDGKRFVQIRGTRKVWFLDIAAANPWDIDPEADPQFVNSETGELTAEAPEDDVLGNAVIPFINYTPLSSWYGLPDHIPAIGSIAGNKAIQDYNWGHISNNTIPQYAVVVQGADLGEELEETIISYFRDHVKGENRATLVIPIPYGDDEVSVKFERLAQDPGDGGFLDLRDANTVEVLMAHGVPPYRVAWAVMGSLGGNLGKDMDEIYKNAVIEARQETIEHRVNRFLIRGALEAEHFLWKLADIDLTDKTADLTLAVTAIEFGLLTPAEARTDVLGKEAGDAPDLFFMSGSLRPVDDPSPTEDEVADAETQRARRDARKTLLELQDTVRAGLDQYRSMLPPSARKRLDRD